MPSRMVPGPGSEQLPLGGDQAQVHRPGLLQAAVLPGASGKQHLLAPVGPGLELGRQAGAIAALRVRYRINERWRSWCHDTRFPRTES